MNKFIKNNPKISIVIITIIITAIFHTLGLILFYFWNGSVVFKPNNEFDVLGAVITYMVGVLSIITIGFLYINYTQVKDQNDKNNSDIEYNRVIDLVYKQLEFNKERNTEDLAKVNTFVKKIAELNDRYSIGSLGNEESEPSKDEKQYILYEFLSILNIISKDFTVYNSFLVHTNLKLDFKKNIMELAVNNYCYNLYDTLYEFQFMYFDIKQSLNIKKVGINYSVDSIEENKLNALCSRIDFEYRLVMMYLFNELINEELYNEDE